MSCNDQNVDNRTFVIQEKQSDAEQEIPVAGSTLFLIDGHAQFFRAYHAIRTNLTSPVTGEPTNATFGFVTMLLKIFQQYQPEYLALVIDVSSRKDLHRTKLYPDYKANRESPPIDFPPQVQRSIEVAKILGIPVLSLEGYEADDVLASVVTRYQKEHPDLEIRLISKDKDLEQLLSQTVSMFDVHKNESITVESLLEKKNITPDQVVDMLTLMGDSSDNIPGVSGIGPKTASQLISTYGTLENLFANISEIKGKRREKLENAIDTVKLGKQLVQLVCDLDIPFELCDAKIDFRTISTIEVMNVLTELGFGRLQNEFAQLLGSDTSQNSQTEFANAHANRKGAVAKNVDADADMPLFAGLDITSPSGTLIDAEGNIDLTALPDEPTRGEYISVLTQADLDACILEWKKADIISIDTETTSVVPTRAALCGICISTQEHSGYYIPVRSPNSSQHLDEECIIRSLKPLLEDVSIPKCGHNIKYDEIVLRRHGILLAGITFDTMVAGFLVDASRQSLKLDSLALGLLGYRCVPIDSLLGRRKKGVRSRTFDEVPLEIACMYAAEDADITLRLRNILEPQIRAMGLSDLSSTIEMPLVSVLADMEYHGIRVDPDVLDEQRIALSEQIIVLRGKILADSPREFNVDSPKQLAGILFNKPDDDQIGFGLKVVKRRKTGPSTDVEVLEKLDADPAVTSLVPGLVVQYRQLTKLVNTYLTSLKDSINPDTGRVHASFNQTVAATGRLSSSDPNLQNIPVRTEVGRQIRKAFIADEGYKLITADYSQIELRILAHLSEDDALIAAFQAGEDIHKAVAAEVFGVDDVSKVTKSQRDSAKMVNFGIIYGISAFGLARRLGGEVTNSEADRIIKDYRKRFVGIDAFLDQCVEQAKKLGYVETMFKRRRAVPQVLSRNAREAALGSRVAINSVVQGSAADLIKVAMVDLHAALPEAFPKVKMLLQIHDELVFEVPEDEVDSVLSFVVDKMETAVALKVPLIAESSVASNWMEAK